MGLLDRLFGRRRRDDHGYDHDHGYGQGYGPGDGRYAERWAPAPAARTADEQALERYRYLLRTAPPDQVEQAHTEAFEQLTPEQRRQVLAQLADAVPAGERPAGDDPRTLARAATRAELRQPGFMERTFGGHGSPGYGGGYGPGGYGRGGYGPGYGGPGIGGMVGGGLLGTIGGLVIGSAVADALFDTGLGDGGLFGGGDEEAYAAGYEDGAGGWGDPGGDGGFAGGDHGGGDFGGGDFGGDFGGGDF
ncbi:hypothetical protein [Blastococcus sp. VKM Ac-2987]|uniref:hypothetical protein n=1 Tax=Blastococcus sp. VKM Ac-2987 TaxID=3004141 RepID=UPI0022AB5F81|nr:hypothetical protein [Blastococcus sp. VKM Ac-2987]MCZ2858865.1 hypothetical protein [Blastococcus sp. VKM Ac-2987]